MRSDDAKHETPPRENEPGGVTHEKKPYKPPRLEKYEQLHKIGVGYA